MKKSFSFSKKNQNNLIDGAKDPFSCSRGENAKTAKTGADHGVETILVLVGGGQ
jgi:hypothetical protein